MNTLNKFFTTGVLNKIISIGLFFFVFSLLIGSDSKSSSTNDSLINILRNYRAEVWGTVRDIDNERYSVLSLDSFSSDPNRYISLTCNAYGKTTHYIAAIFKVSNQDTSVYFYEDGTYPPKTDIKYRFKRKSANTIDLIKSAFFYDGRGNSSSEKTQSFSLKLENSVELVQYSYQNKLDRPKTGYSYKQACTIDFKKNFLKYSHQSFGGKETSACCNDLKDSVSLNFISKSKTRLFYNKKHHFGSGKLTSDSTYSFTFFPNTTYENFKGFKIPRDYIQDIGCCFVQNNINQIKKTIKFSNSKPVSTSVKGSGELSMIYGRLTGEGKEDKPVCFIRDLKSWERGDGWPQLGKAGSYCRSIVDIFTFQW